MTEIGSDKNEYYREGYGNNTLVYGDYVMETVSPPIARFFSVGEEEATVDDALQDQPTIRDEVVYVRWVNETVGYGCYTRREFREDEPVGVYTGMITDLVYNTDYRWVYAMGLDIKDFHKKPLDLATESFFAGNAMRFVNDNIHGDQNTRQLFVPMGGVWYNVYVTLRPVEAHEQLFISYGPKYWSSRGVKTNK